MTKITNHDLQLILVRLEERQEERHKTLIEKLELINKWQDNHEKIDADFHKTTNDNFAKFDGLSKKVNFIYTLLGGALVKIYYSFKGGA